jgi:hypothetical protein
MTDRNVMRSVARAIVALDETAFSRSDADRDDVDRARKLLWGVLERNGYEMVEIGSSRIRRRRQGA